MTTDDHRAIICARLSRRISEVVPYGLGHWPEAWGMIEAESDAFLDALSAFLADDTPDTRRWIQFRADELVRAWRRAGINWRKSGRPSNQPEEATR